MCAFSSLFVIHTRVSQLLWSLSFKDDFMGQRLLEDGVLPGCRCSRQLGQPLVLKVVVFFNPLVFKLLRIVQLLVQDIHVFKHLCGVMVALLDLPKKSWSNV